MAHVFVLPHIVLSNKAHLLQVAGQEIVHGIVYKTKKILQADFAAFDNRNLLAVFACDSIDGLLINIFLLARRLVVLPWSRLTLSCYLRDRAYRGEYLLKGVVTGGKGAI